MVGINGVTIKYLNLNDLVYYATNRNVARRMAY